MKMIRSYFIRGFILAIIFSPTILFFQNCSKVSLEGVDDQKITEVLSESSLSIPPSNITQFRAVFLLDVSNSMMFGPCEDSVDVLIPNVEASPNCTSESGVDPEGRRFKMLLNWVAQVRDSIQGAPLPQPTVKFALIPFAGLTSRSSFGAYVDISDSKSVLRKILARLGILNPHQFMSLDDFETVVKTTWTLQQMFYQLSLPVEASASIVNAVETYLPVRTPGLKSTGTSIPFTALEYSNRLMRSELTSLNLTDPKKSRFEVVYVSDGVPKPHSKHIREVIKQIWSIKKTACNTRHSSAYTCCEDHPDVGDGCGWQTVKNGVSCIQRCEKYLSQYVDTGSVSLPRSEQVYCTSTQSGYCSRYSDGSSEGPFNVDSMKCGPCFELIEQYDYSPASQTSLGAYHDNFKNRVGSGWGDWLLNRPSQIFNQIYTTTNLFRKQFPGNRWRLNFIRIDSDKLEDKTQLGELLQEINWFEKAKQIYPKKHRHIVWTQAEPPFALFTEMVDINSYRLSHVIAFPRHARSSIQGWSLDSDADGISDSLEALTASKKSRSNGKCLDILVKKHGSCVTLGCDATIDLDKDGLNQCEERTVGGDDEVADTDEDGILDVLEVIFGFSLNIDDNQIYLSSDGLSNFEHFRRGYSGNIDLTRISDQLKLNVRSEFLGFREAQNMSGQTSLAPTYRIQIANIPVVSMGNGGQLRVFLGIENQNDSSDKIWLFKDYNVNDLKLNQIVVRFEEFELLNLEGP